MFMPGRILLNNVDRCYQDDEYVSIHWWISAFVYLMVMIFFFLLLLYPFSFRFSFSKIRNVYDFL